MVGAGGKGGENPFSGGGGAGEIIYNSSYLFTKGTYNITIGIDSDTFNDRITKINSNSIDLITANGGGDGGYNDIYFQTTNKTYTVKNTDFIINSSLTVNLTGTFTLTQTQGLLNIGGTVYSAYNNLSSGLLPRYWFKFNGDLNDSGDSGTLLNCSSVGTITYNSFDISGIGNTVAGSANHNYVNFNSSLNLYDIWNTYGMTISFWFRGTTQYPNDFDILMIKAYSANLTIRYLSSSANSQTISFMGFESDSGGSIYTHTYSAPSNFFNNTWKHFVWNITSTGVWYIYINNVRILNGTITSRIGNYTYATKILGKKRDAGDFTKLYNLSYKDFRIYRGNINTAAAVNELYLAQCKIITPNTSGGSGGGGGGGLSTNNQTGALKGTPYNVSQSLLNDGSVGTTAQGGDGGSALITGGYTETISGNNMIVGVGGIGATSTSTPSIKSLYGSGGDGSNGNGYQGLVLMKYRTVDDKLTYTGKSKWSNLEDINYDSSKIVVDSNNNYISTLSYTSNQTDNIISLNSNALFYYSSNASNLLNSNISFTSNILYSNNSNTSNNLASFIIATDSAVNTKINNNYYTKAQIDTNIYTKAQVDTNNYTKAQIDTNIYTKTQIDTNNYTKAQVDANTYT